MPLFGTRKLERLEENLGALSVTLTANDLDQIEAANVKIEGARYPEEILRRSGCKLRLNLIGIGRPRLEAVIDELLVGLSE